MPVEEMLARISSRELSEWLAFMQVEPLGEEREDLRLARLCSLVAGAAGVQKKKGVPFETKDFIFDYWETEEERGERAAEEKRADATRMLEMFKMLAQGVNAAHQGKEEN